MPDLTELGLNKPAESKHPVSPISAASPPIEPFFDTRPEAIVSFLDRVLDVIGQLAPESDAGELEAFRTKLEAHRQAVADPRRRAELPQVTDACVAACRSYLESSRDYRSEREKELTEVISILRDAATLSVGDSAEFHAQVIASSERFGAMAELENIRELRKRMGDEVGTLRRAVVEKQERDEHAYAQLTTRVETLQKKLAEMEVEATMDALTRVGNRRRFDVALGRMVSHAQQSGTPLSLAMIDVDHFKNINDTHGHPIGDRVLLCVAQWVAKGVRQTDVVARYGGEEFAVLLPNANASEVEGRMKQLLLDVAGSAYEYDVLGRKERVAFTVSCGLADLIPNESQEDFVKRADEALYEAKRRGRNRVVTRKRSILGRVLAWG
jgi:diguanylate cyclase (GGDEF)-like protein